MYVNMHEKKYIFQLGIWIRRGGNRKRNWNLQNQVMQLRLLIWLRLFVIMVDVMVVEAVEQYSLCSFSVYNKLESLN